MARLGLKSTAFRLRLSVFLTFFLFATLAPAALEIDNFLFDTNTLSVTNSNGHLIFDPPGTGQTRFSDATATTVPYFDANKGLVSSAVTPTELSYLTGVTSALQTQINALAPSSSPSLSNPTFTGTITTPLTASRAVVTGASNELAASATTATEIGYVNGVTSAIQTQIDSKQATGNYITALTGDVTASGPGSVAATIAAGAIVNADVNASAGIDYSKLAALSDGNILVGSAGNVATSVNPSGDIDVSNAGAFSITSGAIVNADVNASAAIDRSKLATGSNYRVLTNGAAGSMTDAAAITASRALISDSNGIPTHSSVTSTELGYVSGATSNIQAQIDAVSSGVVPTSSQDIENLGIKTSVSANALTIALAQADGSTDPAAGTGAVKIGIRSSTLATGGYNQRSVTAALSTTISSGSTAGHSNNVSWKIYVYAIDNAGTVELAWSSTFYDDNGYLVSTTAEGGAGAADSYTTMYSTTARSNVSFRLIGRIVITETAAGTWASNATRIELVPLKMDCRPATGGVGCLATETARLTAGTSSCTINLEVGEWISTATGASSVCTININPGLFSTLVLCSATWGGTSSDQIANCTPSTSVQVLCGVWDVSAATNVNQDFQINCSGLR